MLNKQKLIGGKVYVELYDNGSLSEHTWTENELRQGKNYAEVVIVRIVKLDVKLVEVK